MDFWTYGLRKTWLDKCLKSPVSEDPLTSNMVNGPKHCWNLNDGTFTIFIDPLEGKSGWKIVSDSYAKYYDCLLTHWLSMTSILFLIETIYCNIFRCNYLTKKKTFSDPFLHFANLDTNLKISKKRLTFIANVSLNLRTPKSVVR